MSESENSTDMDEDECKKWEIADYLHEKKSAVKTVK